MVFAAQRGLGCQPKYLQVCSDKEGDKEISTVYSKGSTNTASTVLCCSRMSCLVSIRCLLPEILPAQLLHQPPLLKPSFPCHCLTKLEDGMNGLTGNIAGLDTEIPYGFF